MVQLGVFQIDRMILGLPAVNLREVVPFERLCMMPCESALVRGGIDVRGGVIPVIDLNLVLGRSPRDGYRVVLIMSHEDFVLGMLADQVSGFIEVDDLTPRGETSERRIMLESVVSPACPEPVHLLSLDYLFALPGIPAVHGKRDAAVDFRGIGEAGDLVKEVGSVCARHMIVVRCGGLVMALDSAYVHSTVPCPELLGSPLSGDYCVGAMAFEGKRIAAIDLVRLLGFPPTGENSVRQAFVVELSAGMIACLVEEIVDVVKMDLPSILPIPRVAMPRPEFIAGMYPGEVIAAHETLREKCPAAFLFELCGDAIRNSESLRGLARMNVSHGEEAAVAALVQNSRKNQNSCQVICYDIGYEVATPMDQITEILPWKRETQIFGAGHRPDGIVVSRGHAVPTYELCSLLGEPLIELKSDASVLVVEVDQERLGFVVPRLLSIDHASWPQSLSPAFGGEVQVDAPSGLLGDLGTDPVRVGDPDSFRLVGLVNLQKLARRLCKSRCNEIAVSPSVFSS